MRADRLASLALVFAAPAPIPASAQDRAPVTERVAGLPAPADAGYYADPRWLRLAGPAGTFPHADLGFLAAIPAMGAKFQAADATGPAGLPSVATGEYRGWLLFDLFPPERNRRP